MEDRGWKLSRNALVLYIYQTIRVFFFFEAFIERSR